MLLDMACLLSAFERLARSRPGMPLLRTARSTEVGFWRLGLHELSVESNGHFLTHENATSLKGSVPGQAEILAIDLCARRNRDSSVAPGSLLGGVGPSTANLTFRLTPRMVR